MNKPIRGCLLSFIWALAVTQARSQPIVNGPACVVPGTTYQYLINGPWDSTSSMQVCLQGGVVAELNGPCTANGAPVSSLLVIWNSGGAQGSVELSSSSGNVSLAVSITTPLQAGAIADSDKSQTVGYDQAPATIYCGVDSGGSCHPAYTHQWQQSYNNSQWTDIAGATAADLTGVPALQQTTFFRRKTVESGSGSIAYSVIVTVQVGAPPPGTNMGTNTNE